MQTIFIKIKCQLGESYTTASEAREQVEQISEVYSISGDYDLLLKCYLEDKLDIGHFVNEKIQRLPGVKDTYTIIAFKAFS